MRLVSEALAARESAKASGEHVRAQEARERITAACSQLLDLALRHEEKGTSLDEMREGMALAFAPEALKAIATVLPAFSPEAEVKALLQRQIAPKKRAPAGLSSADRVAGLVARAAERGMTKTELMQAIRPKPKAVELSGLLDTLVQDGRLRAYRKQIQGSRYATRYVSTSADDRAA